MRKSIRISVSVLLQLLALRALADAPPRLSVAVPDSSAPLTFIVYGDTRFTQREAVANPEARHALIGRIASEAPAAIFIGGDLVFEGSNPDDFETYRKEAAAWSQAKIPVFPALGNHEFRGCEHDANRCLVNWWNGAAPSAVRSFRWYSVALGPRILVVMLDSDASLKPGSEQRAWFEDQLNHPGSRVQFVLVVIHYPPVRDPIFPRAKDEADIERYLSEHGHSLPARVVVVSSHIHNYERFLREGVTYLVSGGGGAKPVPVFRMSGELSKLHTAENFHYLRFRLEGAELDVSMVRFEPGQNGDTAWTEPDRFEIKAQESESGRMP